MVQKSNGDWRPCGDYCALNNATEPVRYPIPFLSNYVVNLHGCTIFRRIDLVSAYYKIPMNPDVTQKTEVITPYFLDCVMLHKDFSD